MSSGWGRVELAILQSLEEGQSRSTRPLAAQVYRMKSGAAVTTAQLASVRRALRSLRAEGLIAGDRSQRRWHRTGPPDAAEREAMRRAAERDAVAKSRATKIAPRLDDVVSLEQWHNLDKATQEALLHPDADVVAQSPSPPRFNEQSGTDIEWAMHSSNVITGCEDTCSYCYARELAQSARLASTYPFAFAPTLHPRRLLAPRFMKVPPEAAADGRWRNVFLGSMADMFGRWVPQEWIDAVLAMIAAAPEWNFLCLTKFPKRMAEFDIPANAWMGTTVDLQARVAAAEAAFADVGAAVRWLSCEPLIEPLRSKHLDRFHWIVIGGASRTDNTPEWQPPFEWIADLVRQARDAGLRVYFKTNLLQAWQRDRPGAARRIIELPFDAPIAASPSEAPAVFHYLKPGGLEHP